MGKTGKCETHQVGRGECHDAAYVDEQREHLGAGGAGGRGGGLGGGRVRVRGVGGGLAGGGVRRG